MVLFGVTRFVILALMSVTVMEARTVHHDQQGDSNILKHTHTVDILLAYRRTLFFCQNLAPLIIDHHMVVGLKQVRAGTFDKFGCKMKDLDIQGLITDWSDI